MDDIEIITLYNELLEKNSLYGQFCELHDKIFTPTFTDVVKKEIKNKSSSLMLIAVKNGELCGFKLGYEKDSRTFYSWTGAVAENFRGQGVGSKLMKTQHDWCKSRDYTFVRTKTTNRWKNMIILNLKHGFEIIGSYTDTKGNAKLILEKHL